MSESHTVAAKIELSPALQDDNFVVHSRIEILYFLRGIMRKNRPVTLSVDHGSACILTPILEIEPARGEIVLDYGASEAFNRQALQAETVSFSTSLDEVRIEFVCVAFRKTRFEGRDAFSIAIPQSLLRLQRRKNYRVSSPARNPPQCAIELPAGHDAGIAEVRLLDIGCGGIAVVDTHSRMDSAPGTFYDNCHIALPQIGTVDVAIEVKRASEFTLDNGLVRKRCGCEFVGVTERMLAPIQRYVLTLEQEKAKRMHIR